MIEELGDKGGPIEPKGIAVKFRNIIGAIVRDQLGQSKRKVCLSGRNRKCR
jgi:hypothetical protein